MKLLLKHLAWSDGGDERVGDLRLAGGRIVASGRGLKPGRRERSLDLRGSRVVPGLINAHDHLSLNLLPHLGDPPYDSLYHFAEAVYDPQRSPIREVLATSPTARLWWGGYKNLISGVTTVVHHDPFPRRVLLAPEFPVRVLRRYGWTHSLKFGEDPVASFRASGELPFLIHAAEGVDEASYRELDRLLELGMLRDRTVLIHGIAISASQRRALLASGASLVWCPASNLRLYGETARIQELEGVRIALGTDSTLTGSATLLDEMREAHETGLATKQEIFAMVTSVPAAIFGLQNRGRISEGCAADLVVLAAEGSSSGDVLCRAKPRDLVLVLIGGRPRLARPELADALGLGAPNVRLENSPRWLCGRPGEQLRTIEQAIGAEALGQHPLGRILQAL